MDIKNTLEAPEPKFHLGQAVAWRESRHKTTFKREGIVVGMAYLSAIHGVLDRENIKPDDLCWTYRVSKVEGKSLDDLARKHYSPILIDKKERELSLFADIPDEPVSHDASSQSRRKRSPKTKPTVQTARSVNAPSDEIRNRSKSE